jgi:hypothetical protein
MKKKNDSEGRTTDTKAIEADQEAKTKEASVGTEG